MASELIKFVTERGTWTIPQSDYSHESPPPAPRLFNTPTFSGVSRKKGRGRADFTFPYPLTYGGKIMADSKAALGSEIDLIRGVVGEYGRLYRNHHTGEQWAYAEIIEFNDAVVDDGFPTEQTVRVSFDVHSRWHGTQRGPASLDPLAGTEWGGVLVGQSVTALYAGGVDGSDTLTLTNEGNAFVTDAYISVTALSHTASGFKLRGYLDVDGDSVSYASLTYTKALLEDWYVTINCAEKSIYGTEQDIRQYLRTVAGEHSHTEWLRIPPSSMGAYRLVLESADAPMNVGVSYYDTWV